MAQPHRRKVVGIVEAWGRIELHSMGFRARFARPVAFVNPDWLKPPQGPARRERVFYETRLFDLAVRCGAEVIDPTAGESVIEWLRNDDRFLEAATIRELLR